MKIAKTDIVFIALALVTGTLCLLLKGPPAVLEALSHAGLLLLGILPQLAAGLLIGGLVTRLVSKERVAGMLGAGSGARGLALATLAGALTPGGPFTSFPLVYALWTAGADAGALIAYIAAWSLLGFNRLIVWELPLMGAEFTWIRLVACLPLPMLAGLLARYISRLRAFELAKAPAE
ncbi:hypothetical protein P1J78_05550 [Psychromarinibacter sp. C21-152]|uniref:Permease n=1 Tax=Psychromarinibacter sediminicola TaxID=3033385 RepID=A0AAE3T7Y3_9RHOB|nr:hypothetical protein [Psychromarinibacter sediminicola]MDF0600188.1 hypothetical protein [Psychromarinibacter sediminicola]